MKDELISFDTAILAKQKGFSLEQTHFFNAGSGWKLQSDYLIRTGSDVFVECPTQSLLQRWLREKYLIYISVNAETIGSDEWEWVLQDTTSPERTLGSQEKMWSFRLQNIFQ
jgi:hypothetical protein